MPPKQRWVNTSRPKGPRNNNIGVFKPYRGKPLNKPNQKNPNHRSVSSIRGRNAPAFIRGADDPKVESSVADRNGANARRSEENGRLPSGGSSNVGAVNQRDDQRSKPVQGPSSENQLSPYRSQGLTSSRNQSSSDVGAIKSLPNVETQAGSADAFRDERRLEGERWERAGMNPYNFYNNIAYDGYQMIRPFTSFHEFQGYLTPTTANVMRQMSFRFDKYYSYAWTAFVERKTIAVVGQHEHLREAVYLGLLNQKEYSKTWENDGRSVIYVANNHEQAFKDLCYLNNHKLQIRSVLKPSEGVPLVCCYDTEKAEKVCNKAEFIVVENWCKMIGTTFLATLMNSRTPCLLMENTSLSPSAKRLLCSHGIDIVDYQETELCYNNVHIIHCKPDITEKVDSILRTIKVDNNVCFWSNNRKAAFEAEGAMKKGGINVECLLKIKKKDAVIVRQNCINRNFGTIVTNIRELQLQDIAVFLNVPVYSRFKSFIEEYYQNERLDTKREVYVLFSYLDKNQAKRYCTFADEHGCVVSSQIRALAGGR